MRKNKHFEKEKEFIRLQKQLAKNWETQMSLGWSELTEPKFIGYNACLEPRQDIQNRDDAWVFWYICQNFGTKTFAKKIELFDWERKGKSIYKTMIYHIPRIHGINEWTYLNLPSQVRKWFTDEVPFHVHGWNRHSKSYYCKIPNFYFDIKYEKEYKTKVKIYSTILEQEEAEIEYILDTKFYHECRNYRRHRKAPKHFRKFLNRSQRAKSKQTLFNIMGGKDCEFEDNYSGADWLWD